MTKTKLKSQIFYKGLEKLGFYEFDDSLYLTEVQKKLSDPQIEFHIEKAREFKASAVYIRKQLQGSYKPQAFLFDYTGKLFLENDLTEIQKKIWSSGASIPVPAAC